MLESLDIGNLALIEDIHIDFHSGFNVLTGETGAGKSIILGALGLLLGEKADGSAVRFGAEEATVSAVVSIDESHRLASWLQEHAVEPDEGGILIRRVVKSIGRGTIHVQSVPMTRADLGIIADALFDIHGQHEHQSLLHADRQLQVLDSFGALGRQVDDFARLYRKLEEAKEKQQILQKSIAQEGKEEEYLRFVSEELQRAALKEGEDVQLEDETRVLSQYEAIHGNLELVRDSLKGSDSEGAAGALGTALQSCKRAAKADPSLVELCQRLESLLLEAQDIAESVRDRLASMSFSRSRLDELQSRLALLQRLKKKYGPSLSDMIAFRDSTMQRLAGAERSDAELQELDRLVGELEMQMESAATALSDERMRHARKLETQIALRLARLGMPHVVFTINVQQCQPTFRGADRVDFTFSANPGEPKRSLREIASGGELSRVMLAIKTVLAEADDVETLVFDEIDAGIGGSVAIAVGEHLAELAASRQVVAITHLASIAVHADRHLVVHKEISAGRTYTRIKQVDGEERVQEIARMLAGDARTDAAVAHARSLLAGREHPAQEKFNSVRN